jgi:hypothetical protein
MKLSRTYELTYAATVLELNNGLRKLARVNTDCSTVYRGIRGELPTAFWLRDEFGYITATDFAYMSTSLKQDVCTQFMDSNGQNLLWEIQCTGEDAEGYHCGADVSLVSQWPKENEILFPPLTMLTVVEDAEDANGANSSSGSIMPRTGGETQQIDGRDVSFTRVVVRPTFI